MFRQAVKSWLQFGQSARTGLQYDSIRRASNPHISRFHMHPAIRSVCNRHYIIPQCTWFDPRPESYADANLLITITCFYLDLGPKWPQFTGQRGTLCWICTHISVLDLQGDIDFPIACAQDILCQKASTNPSIWLPAEGSAWSC